MNKEVERAGSKKREEGRGEDEGHSDNESGGS